MMPMTPSALHRAFLRVCSTALLWGLALGAPSCKERDRNDQPPSTTGDAQSAPAPPNGNGGGEQPAQWYRAWVVGGPEVGEVPFFLQLPAQPNRGAAVVANGTQRIEAEARWHGPEVAVNHALLRTRMFLRRDDTGALEGHMMSHSPVADGKVSLPVKAVPVPEPDETRRFTDVASCGAPPRAGERAEAGAGQVSDNEPGGAAGEPSEPWGRWLTSFESSRAVELVLAQPHAGVVSANFTFTDGSVVVLFGNAFDRRICLSGFDGVNAYAVVLDIEPGNAGLQGRWVAGPGLGTRLSFTAEKREQVEVGSNTIVFTPNRTKVSLFELGLPQYRGKPLVVEFGASWCPPCLDSAPVLRELYEKHHGQGLEIVTLLFELLDDEDALRRQARLFVDTHRIPWQVIPVRGEIKPYWDIIPHDPDIAEVNLPVTIFVNRDGTIRYAHTGFPGPESGKPYQDMVERYQRAAAELVAE